MNVGLFMGHPAHFHVLRNTAITLRNAGHNVYIVAKKKDILEDLLCSAGFEYTLIRQDRGSAKIDLVKSVLQMELNMCKFISNNEIDILIGSTLTFATRIIRRIPVIVIGEDDARVIPLLAGIAYPFASYIVSPISCDNGRWNNKSIKYAGYQKLAYLHPNQFTPDDKVVQRYGIDIKKSYFLIRFAKLTAHHDTGVHGIETMIAQRMIDILTKYGKIYITSERVLEPQFEKYRLNINPLDIHHIMAYATLYIGDSQSMAVEAAMLGVPSLRFNDFVETKKIGVLSELEEKYGLTYGIASTNPDKLYSKINELLTIPNLRDVWQNRRQKMLSEKIDTSKFLTWFIENYPSSAEQTRNANSTFWQQFK